MAVNGTQKGQNPDNPIWFVDFGSDSDSGWIWEILFENSLNKKQTCIPFEMKEANLNLNPNFLFGFGSDFDPISVVRFVFGYHICLSPHTWDKTLSCCCCYCCISHLLIRFVSAWTHTKSDPFAPLCRSVLIRCTNTKSTWIVQPKNLWHECFGNWMIIHMWMKSVLARLVLKETSWKLIVCPLTPVCMS